MTAAGFWDRVAVRYAARPIGNVEAYEATLARITHWLSPQMSVLELGCGTGSTALRLAGGVERYMGTDQSGEMLRIAEGKATDVPNLSFVQAGAGTAGAGQRFDAVLAFNLLHLVDDRAAVLRHVRGLLAEGGLFISKTPCLGGKPWFRPLVWTMQRLGKAPAPVHYLRPGRLGAEIAAAGFEVIETGDYPRNLPNHFIVARAV